MVDPSGQGVETTWCGPGCTNYWFGGNSPPPSATVTGTFNGGRFDGLSGTASYGEFDNLATEFGYTESFVEGVASVELSFGPSLSPASLGGLGGAPLVQVAEFPACPLGEDACGGRGAGFGVGTNVEGIEGLLTISPGAVGVTPKGTIYKVPGSATKSGKPYVGRHNGPNPQNTRSSPDGRDRTKAEVVDRYDASNTREGRMKEQQAIDREGGVNSLDNKRNEIAPNRRDEYGL